MVGEGRTMNGKQTIHRVIALVGVLGLLMQLG
jgi:hypothetical protein